MHSAAVSLSPNTLQERFLQGCFAANESLWIFWWLLIRCFIGNQKDYRSVCFFTQSHTICATDTSNPTGSWGEVLYYFSKWSDSFLCYDNELSIPIIQYPIIHSTKWYAYIQYYYCIFNQFNAYIFFIKNSIYNYIFI